MPSKKDTSHKLWGHTIDFILNVSRDLYEHVAQPSAGSVGSVETKPEFFDTAGACRYYATSDKKLREWERAGFITGHYINGDRKKRWKRSELDRHFADTREPEEDDFNLPP